MAYSYEGGGDRQSGRTTNLALAYVRKALDNAGKQVEVRDHYDTWRSHSRLTFLVHQLLDVLQVPHDFSVHLNWIKVHP